MLIALAEAGIMLGAAASLVGYSLSTAGRLLRKLALYGDLNDLPRPGRPAIYNKAIESKLIGFYCQTQPLPNCGRWTTRWAAKHLKAHPTEIGVSPSSSTIQRLLKKNQLKPHKSYYFLQITDPDFFPKMEHLLRLFEKPPKNLTFFDECPGIQILKRLAPDLRSAETKQRLEEFEYSRNGTMDVLAFFNNSDGKVSATCCADHKAPTFLKVFTQHVLNSPDKEELHYVMDNLSTHSTYEFCQKVATLSKVSCPSEKELNSVVKRRAWLSGEHKRIVIHFTPFHGSWLNRVELWFSILNKGVLSESFGSSEELKTAIDAFVINWNELRSHSFKWEYTGKGLHEKAVSRFTQMLEFSCDKLDASMLAKQCSLMVNLLTEDYFKKISINIWDKLLSMLKSQHAVLANIIDNENGPIRKKNAEKALSRLMTTIEAHEIIGSRRKGNTSVLITMPGKPVSCPYGWPDSFSFAEAC